MKITPGAETLPQLCSAELEMEFYYQNASLANATITFPTGETISKQKVQWLASWLDFSSIMLFLVATLFIVLYQQHVLVEVASRTVTVVDYSLQVWDLPLVRCTQLYLGICCCNTCASAYCSPSLLHQVECKPAARNMAANTLMCRLCRLHCCCIVLCHAARCDMFGAKPACARQHGFKEPYCSV